MAHFMVKKNCLPTYNFERKNIFFILFQNLVDGLTCLPVHKEVYLAQYNTLKFIFFLEISFSFFQSFENIVNVSSYLQVCLQHKTQE